MLQPLSLAAPHPNPLPASGERGPARRLSQAVGPPWLSCCSSCFPRRSRRACRRARRRICAAGHRRAEGAGARGGRGAGPTRRRGGWRWWSRTCRRSRRTFSEERKGPRVSAPEQAIAGFLKSARASPRSRTRQVVKDDKKGDFYVVTIEKPGRAGQGDRRRGGAGRGREVSLAEVDALGLGARRTWVRPLHSIVCLLDGKVVPFEIEDVESGNEDARASLPRQRAVRGDGLRPTTPRALKAHKVILDPARARGADRRAGARAGQGAQAGAGRGRGAARRERRPHRMADRADGQLRRGVPGACRPNA